MKPLVFITAALLPGAARAAASYEVRPFEWLDADHRIIIGVPSGFEDLMGERVGKRETPFVVYSLKAPADHPTMNILPQLCFTMMR